MFEIHFDWKIAEINSMKIVWMELVLYFVENNAFLGFQHLF